jgi:hypothetical protein
MLLVATWKLSVLNLLSRKLNYSTSIVLYSREEEAVLNLSEKRIFFLPEAMWTFQQRQTIIEDRQEIFKGVFGSGIRRNGRGRFRP